VEGTKDHQKRHRHPVGDQAADKVLAATLGKFFFSPSQHHSTKWCLCTLGYVWIKSTIEITYTLIIIFISSLPIVKKTKHKYDLEKNTVSLLVVKSI